MKHKKTFEQNRSSSTNKKVFFLGAGSLAVLFAFATNMHNLHRMPSYNYKDPASLSSNNKNGLALFHDACGVSRPPREMSKQPVEAKVADMTFQMSV